MDLEKAFDWVHHNRFKKVYGVKSDLLNHAMKSLFRGTSAVITVGEYESFEVVQYG